LVLIPYGEQKIIFINKKTQILGRFIEELRDSSEIEKRLDLVISAHTFEHAEDLFDQFKMLIGLATVKKGFMSFLELLRLAHEQLVQLDEPCYGFGAAQMLPVLTHHMGSDLGFLKALIDDNGERIGKCLPGIDCFIVAPS
tara:strand:- start:7494 stop:7916 length:423 start_codon:yes stop_codon:yes gene_type:complete